MATEPYKRTKHVTQEIHFHLAVNIDSLLIGEAKRRGMSVNRAAKEIVQEWLLANAQQRGL